MENFDRVEKVIQFLDENRKQQPGLADIADHLGLSESHLHRLFSEWAGITPKAFLKCLTLEHATTLLKNDFSVLDTTLESGLSGPGRLHDLCVTIQAASPGEIKSGGAGWQIMVGFAKSPFGHCLIAENDRGICHLSFVPNHSKTNGQQVIHASWPNAKLVWKNGPAQKIADQIFTRPTPEDAGQPASTLRLNAYVKGTSFQVLVWRALLRLPAGYLTSYGELARSINKPSSARAVGTAIGSNPIAFLIPCHRVIRATGICGEYRWGSARKKALIAWESMDRD